MGCQVRKRERVNEVIALARMYTALPTFNHHKFCEKPQNGPPLPFYLPRLLLDALPFPTTRVFPQTISLSSLLFFYVFIICGCGLYNDAMRIFYLFSTLDKFVLFYCGQHFFFFYINLVVNNLFKLFVKKFFSFNYVKI